MYVRVRVSACQISHVFLHKFFIFTMPASMTFRAGKKNLSVKVRSMDGEMVDGGEKINKLCVHAALFLWQQQLK